MEKRRRCTIVGITVQRWSGDKIQILRFFNFLFCILIILYNVVSTSYTYLMCEVARQIDNFTDPGTAIGILFIENLSNRIGLLFIEEVENFSFSIFNFKLHLCSSHSIWWFPLIQPRLLWRPVCAKTFLFKSPNSNMLKWEVRKFCLDLDITVKALEYDFRYRNIKGSQTPRLSSSPQILPDDVHLKWKEEGVEPRAHTW